MTTEPHSTIAVLVVSYGSHDLVELNLDRTAMPEGTRVVVVDNFTTTAEREAITALCGERGWHLVAPATNLGFGRGMNAAADAAISAGAAVLVLLNPDAYINGDGVLRLAERVMADPSAQVSPVVSRPDGHHFSSLMEVDLARGRLRRLQPGRPYDLSAPWVSGACFAMSADQWRRVGGFDDDYFLYWEDVDLSLRVREAGGNVVVDDQVSAVHSPGGTQSPGSRGKSPTYYYFNARNRLVFAAKHAERRYRGAWLRGSAGAGWNLLSRGGRRQLLHPARSVWPVLRGTVAGLRFLRESSRHSGSRR